MRKLAKKYASLPSPAKDALWGIYGAVAWGGAMTLFFFCFAYAMGHDPWKHFTYTLIVCITLGAFWGGSIRRKIERMIQERIRP